MMKLMMLLENFLACRTKQTKQEEAMTLIELLAVIVILGVIATIAVPVVLGSVTQAKVNTTKQSMLIIDEALNRYAANHDGQFPTPSGTASGTGNHFYDASTALTVLSQPDASNGNQPYIQSIPTDGWGLDFYYYPAPVGATNYTEFELATAKGAGVAPAGSNDQSFYITSNQSTPTATTPSAFPY